MGWLTTLFTGTAGRIIAYIVAGLIGVGAVVGVYFMVTNNARQTQSLLDQKRQLEQVIKNQKEFADKTKALEEETKRLSDSLDVTIQQIESKNQKLNDFLDQVEKQKGDRAASPILKETIKQLRENK